MHVAELANWEMAVDRFQGQPSGDNTNASILHAFHKLQSCCELISSSQDPKQLSVQRQVQSACSQPFEDSVCTDGLTCRHDSKLPEGF